MAEFSSHAPGTFSWVELSTTDQKGGVSFYRGLFGWEVNEQPMGPGETYSMFQMRGRDVAAASGMRPDERQKGVPSHWNLYVTVTDVDQAATKAEAFGGRILAPPFDVMDVGRMAVLQDELVGSGKHVVDVRFHVPHVNVNVRPATSAEMARLRELPEQGYAPDGFDATRRMRDIELLVEVYLAAERDLVAAVASAGGNVPLPDGRAVTVGRAEFDALLSGRCKRAWVIVRRNASMPPRR